MFCGSIELDREDPKGHTALNPVQVVEVLSTSTANYDRGKKGEHYQQLTSLRALLVVDHEQRRVSLWARDDEAAAWQHSEHTEQVPLACVELELSVDELYFDALSGGCLVS